MQAGVPGHLSGCQQLGGFAAAHPTHQVCVGRSKRQQLFPFAPSAVTLPWPPGCSGDRAVHQGVPWGTGEAGPTGGAGGAGQGQGAVTPRHRGGSGCNRGGVASGTCLANS